MNIQKHIALLGLKAVDRVTGFSGVISSVSFDLFGCIQVVLIPNHTKDDKEYKSGVWLDLRRLEIKSKIPVMDVPDFEYGNVAEGKQGAVEKPMFAQGGLK